MKKLWMLLEEEIKQQYQISDPEWVQVEISKNSKIHVTIVSDQKIKKDDIRNLIRNEIERQNELYTVGFIDIYSVEEARELDIVKVNKNSKVCTWAEGLNADRAEQEADSDLEVISFYSYKGGVGRTVALIQTAYNLARAGKRVLMLDLDIEAPSLHNLFSKQVNDPFSGVRYGVVDYLYHTVVQRRKDISSKDICCQLQLNDIDGAMFLIPALKRMNKQYLYRIGRLQTEKIHDDQVFGQLFREIRQEFAIDLILIDTRAGFNPWGSLSLLALSTQVIFVAYPNEENIEGLNVAFEMMENVGKQRYAVAMSKVVAKDRGIRRARSLFDNLKVAQESLIPILYREEIALNKEYPLVSEEVTSAYNVLSDYILDSERIVFNREFLSDGRKQDMLRQVFADKKELVILSDIRRFILRNMYVLLIYNNEEELYGLEDSRYTQYMIKKNRAFPVDSYLFFGRTAEDEYSNIFSDSEMSAEQRGLELIRVAVRHFSKRELLPEKLKNIENMSLEEVLESLKENTNHNYDMFLEKEYPQIELEFREAMSKLQIFIPVTDKMFGANISLLTKRIKELIVAFNKKTELIQFKFLIVYSQWERYQEFFGEFKGLIMNLEVGKNDILDFIYKNLNKSLIETYVTAVQIHNGRIEKPDMGHLSKTAVKYVLELIFGVWKNSSTYSISVCDYICQFFEQHREIKYGYLLDALQTAAKRELENLNKENSDRLIGFDVLKEELEKCIILQDGKMTH